MPVPNSFANVTTSIPLSQLDANFNTPITLGNTAIQLGNTVTTLNNMTLANVTISTGNVTLTNATVTTANVTTANIGTEIVTTSQTLNYGTANGVVYLNASKVSTTGTALVFDGTNMGLGVTPSAWTSYKVLSANDRGLSFAGGSESGTITLNAYYDGIWRFAGTSIYKSARYDFFNGSHYWFTGNSGSQGNAVTFTQIMQVEGSRSLALEGAVTQAGTGITFPATQSASSNANTLDDYEEGTWTPTATGFTTAGTTTYTSQVGRYTKIGRQVTATFRVAYSAATGTGNLIVGGFPFTALEAIGPAMTDSFNWTNAGSPTWYISGGTTAVIFISSDDAPWSVCTISNEAADLIGTITYFV